MVVKISSRRATAPPAVARPAIAFALVGATLAAATLAGPAAAGTVAAFPALSTTLAFVVARRRGREAAATALRGAIRGLRGYLAFCVAAAALGAPAGLAACALVFSVARRAACSASRRPESAAR